MPLRATAISLLVTLLVSSATSAQPTTSYRFSFIPTTPDPDSIAITPATTYTHTQHYGFDLATAPTPLRAGGVTADRPFFFSVDLPEGNYTVTVTLGDTAADATTTVKAESRRLMLENVRALANHVETRTFTVNLRTPALPDGGKVKLKPRELSYLHWDDKLTLEFSGAHPALRALTIAPAPPDTITLYLAGDSTVTDQPKEPYNSWGQMLPRFFNAHVAVANHAESGESLKSFTGARRIDKILSTIKPGDYLFIQFGHNDQKDKSPGAGAYTTYKAALQRYIHDARQRKAIPVLITPVSRRSFDPAGHIANNLGDFPDAVRQTAKEENVPLIDLNALSKPFYEALGPDASKRAFAPGANTHNDNYGRSELAKCVAQSLRDQHLDLAQHLTTDWPPFNPAHPDPIDQFSVPPSPTESTTPKPDGN